MYHKKQEQMGFSDGYVEIVWYGLSNERLEAMVNDSLSAMRFCDLCIEDDIPDHSVLSRFRSELTQKKSFDRLFKKINGRLCQHGIIVANAKK